MAKKAGKAKGTYGMHMSPATKPGKVVAGMYNLMPSPKGLPKPHKRTAADIRAGK
jgi:hypothetical protein